MRGAVGGCRLGWLVFVGLLAACDEAPQPPPSVVSAQPRFTALGRWPGPPRLSYGLDHEGARLPEESVEALAREALAIWEATGLVRFHPAPLPERADLLFAWRPAEHEGCPPFARSEGIVAHAGPPRPPSFVHFDSSASWSPRGEDGHSFLATALHEVGHVLGLGHSPDETAVMYGQYDPRKIALTPSDVAGLTALYGRGRLGAGLERGPADVYVFDGPAGTPEGRGMLAPVTVLPSAVPPGERDLAVVDVDGDGRDEILTWSLPEAEHQDLMIYRFDDALNLASTEGPITGVMSPGRETVICRVASDGRALMLLIGTERRYQALLFDPRGRPRIPWPAGTPLELEGGLADAEGDGVLDVAESPKMRAARRGESPDTRARHLLGDLNGDGEGDAVVIGT